jgi:hypothetical protein
MILQHIEFFRVFHVSYVLHQQNDRPHALLLHKKDKMPLLWQVLANMFKHRIGFGFNHDSDGMSSSALGLETGSKLENKILIYPAGSDEPVMYEGDTIPSLAYHRTDLNIIITGMMKAEALSKFFRSVMKGANDLNSKRKEEEEPRGDEEKVFGATREKSTDEKLTSNIGDESVPTAVVNAQEPQLTDSNLKEVKDSESEKAREDSIFHSDTSMHIADEL